MPGAAARITLTRAGHAIIEVAAHEMGMGTFTVTTMVAAERLGLPMDRIEVRYDDSIIPGTITAGGSQQTAAIGAAVIAALNALVAELLKLARLSHDEIGSEDGALVKLDEPAERETYASILDRAQRDTVVVTEEASQPLELIHWSMHWHSAIF